jgi:alpha-tubulin suppressor-like RCC1 family protein
MATEGNCHDSVQQPENEEGEETEGGEVEDSAQQSGSEDFEGDHPAQLQSEEGEMEQSLRAHSDASTDASTTETAVHNVSRRCVQVSAGYSHTALLFENGTALARGNNSSGQCDLPKDAGYKQVSAGGAHTVLLHESGVASAYGSNEHQQCDIPAHVEDPTVRYVRVSAGRSHTVLLREDGLVEAVGCNDDGQCAIPELEAGVSYVQASAGGHHTVLLRSDGQACTVGLTGEISIPQVAKYQSWMDFVMTKPVLPEGVEYVPDCHDLPVNGIGDKKEAATQ